MKNVSLPCTCGVVIQGSLVSPTAVHLWTFKKLFKATPFIPVDKHRRKKLATDLRCPTCGAIWTAYAEFFNREKRNRRVYPDEIIGFNLRQTAQAGIDLLSKEQTVALLDALRES